MGPTPVYGARAEKPLQNADFAMKQTNICRLSGDINNLSFYAANAHKHARKSLQRCCDWFCLQLKYKLHQSQSSSRINFVHINYDKQSCICRGWLGVNSLPQMKWMIPSRC